MNSGYLIVIFIILLKIHLNCGSWCNFWRGRRYNGNVGDPSNCPSEPNLLDLSSEHYVVQDLDHFDQTNRLTWRQRYYVNSTNYKRAGPVFLMLSGESAANPRWMVQGAWTHYAREHNALMFLLEHRFYGNSKPTFNLSTENLIYLTSNQAIEDATKFIVQMIRQYKLPRNTKWFTFGGSYGGSLATWLRLKHSNLVHAAVATSAPILAQLDFQDYFRIVENSLASFSEENGNCVDAIAEAFAQVKAELQTLDGQQNLNDKLFLCDPVQTAVLRQKDISNLLQNLAGQFAFVVQYNSTMSLMDINQMCSIMTNSTIGSALDRFAKANQLVLDSQRSPCLDYKYDKMLEAIKDFSWKSDAAHGARQWTFQTCNEFGFYQTPYKRSRVFGTDFPIEFYIQQCTDIFGQAFNKTSLYSAVQQTNDCYDGLNPRTTNVFTIQGSSDPWHALGLRFSPNHLMPTEFLEGCAHCSDMYEPHAHDSLQLRQVRVKISRWIGSLLKHRTHTYYDDFRNN